MEELKTYRLDVKCKKDKISRLYGIKTAVQVEEIEARIDVILSNYKNIPINDVIDRVEIELEELGFCRIKGIKHGKAKVPDNRVIKVKT